MWNTAAERVGHCMYTIIIIITYTDQWEILFVDELDNARTEIETQAQSTANFKGMLRKLLWLSRNIIIYENTSTSCLFQ